MPKKKAAAPAVEAASVPAYMRGRQVKLILPVAVAARIEKQAREEGKPQSRVIADDLSQIPQLKAQAHLSKLVGAMDQLLLHHNARFVLSALTEQAFLAMDRVLEAQSAGNHMELLARLDGMRVLRTTMLKHERAAKERPNLAELVPLSAIEPDQSE